MTRAVSASLCHSPRAAYVHVPFCRHRCGYCNFTVVAGRDDLTAQYLQALQCELESLGKARKVDTLFVGGGTPTHLASQDLRRLLELIATWFPLNSSGEWSCEANPVDIDPQCVELLASHGVNRLSLGAQSFDPAKLTWLERDHKAETIAQAVQAAKTFIGNVSLDLIFAVPGEALDIWRRDLARAIELEPEHISTYGLTFERGARFYADVQRGRVEQVDDELQREMYLAAIETLEQAGYEHYEVSNFARPDYRCRHNEIYWSGDTYFGVGPGAARYVDGVRQVNHRSTSTWMRRVLAGQSPAAESECLGAEDRAREAVVLGLRRIEGIDTRAFASRFGFDVESLLGDSLQAFIERDLLIRASGRLRLSRDGLLVSDSLWPKFLRR